MFTLSSLHFGASWCTMTWNNRKFFHSYRDTHAKVFKETTTDIKINWFYSNKHIWIWSAGYQSYTPGDLSLSSLINQSRSSRYVNQLHHSATVTTGSEHPPSASFQATLDGAWDRIYKCGEKHMSEDPPTCTPARQLIRRVFTRIDSMTENRSPRHLLQLHISTDPRLTSREWHEEPRRYIDANIKKVKHLLML